jgi:NAD(P)H-flavin reductase
MEALEIDREQPALDSMHPTPARVTQVRKDTPDTFTLTLEPEGEEPLPSFLPGQFSMLYVFGVGELPISISGDPQERGKLVYTVRSVGKTTHALVSRKVGDTVGVRGPFGKPWPLKSARGKDVIVIAGGIGLAPLRPVIYYILRHRADYGRLVVLYGARSPRDLLYQKQLESWARLPDLSWHGHVGVVTTLFRYIRLQPLHSVAMVCGPEIMMRYVAWELEARGLPQGDLYVSLERNMKCGIGFCGHCQFGPDFICKDGPIFTYREMRPWLGKYEL